MKIRSRLVGLIVAAVVPVLAFSVVTVVLLWQQERRSIERGMRETAQALSVAVDREVYGSFTTLEALAASEHIDRGDLAAFYAQCRRVQGTQGGWQTIVLHDPSGRTVFNLFRPFGTALPDTADRASLEEAVTSRKPVLTGLLHGPISGTNVTVRVPVIRGGQVRYVLSAALSPQRLSQVLEQQDIRRTWLSSITDRNFVTIARTWAPEKFIGTQVGGPLRSAITGRDEGFVRVITREGVDVFTAFRRSRLTGWVTTMTVPAAEMETPLWRSLLLVMLGGVVLLALGVALALLAARRIARPIASLSMSAAALGRGETPPVVATGIDEVDQVSRALAAAADERRAIDERLRAETDAMEVMRHTGQIISAELDLGKVVQAVTDAATRLAGARFGAFFYNVADDRGGSYMLYTLSGVSRDAFAGFPMPRNTAVFSPTFRGEGVVRSDDILADPRYGQSPPHHGMPSGHLPVRSYLAVPVVSRSGEVLGGLFFGHPDPGVFTERSERLVVGLAAQAAVAMDNARLYESERHAREEAERANRSKDEFLAVLSHELRTPLNAVLGWARMLRTGQMDPSATGRALAVIERNAEAQRQLIEDLLDISRITTGKLRLEMRPCLPATVVRAALDAVRPAVEAKELTVTTELDARAGPVAADPDRLQQVVWNLLTNAIKFTPRGGRVDVRLQRTDGQVELTVQDTGTGIPAEALPYIFERFRQADSSSTRLHGGLGLGLALVRHLVELHGGSVEAKSAGPGEGATFLVTLPLAPGAQP